MTLSIAWRSYTGSSQLGNLFIILKTYDNDWKLEPLASSSYGAKPQGIKWIRDVHLPPAFFQMGGWWNMWQKRSTNLSAQCHHISSRHQWPIQVLLQWSVSWWWAESFYLYQTWFLERSIVSAVVGNLGMSFLSREACYLMWAPVL